MRIEQRDRHPGDLRIWLACVGALLLIAAGLVWLHRCGLLVCLFHQVTGLPCLTCGATRALAALAEGDLVGALKVQPLVVVGGVFAVISFSVHAYRLVCLRRVASLRCSQRELRFLVAGGSALLLLNWLYLVRCGL